MSHSLFRATRFVRGFRRAKCWSRRSVRREGRVRSSSFNQPISRQCGKEETMQILRKLWDQYRHQYAVLLFSEHYFQGDRLCGVLSVHRGKKAADKIVGEATAKLREGTELYNSFGLNSGRQRFVLRVQRVGESAVSFGQPWDWDHYFTELPSVLRDRNL